MKNYIIVTFLLAFWSCESNKEISDNNSSELEFSEEEIIKSTVIYSTEHDKNDPQLSMSSDDIDFCLEKTEIFLDLNRENFNFKPFEDYYIQLQPKLNENGEKIVFINAMCSVSGAEEGWKKRIISVHDGGPCYFSFYLNLITNKIGTVTVNGVA